MRTRIISVLFACLFFILLCSCAQYGTEPEFSLNNSLEVSNRNENTTDSDATTEAVIDSLYSETTNDTLFIEPETVPLETTVPPLEIDDLVVDAFTGESVFLDGSEFFFHIPRVTIETAEIEQANRELYETAFPDVQQAMEANEKEEMPNICMSNYEWAVNGDVLSLHYWVEPYATCCEYDLVYNFSISKGKVLAKEDLLQIVGWSLSEFEEKCRQVLISQLINDSFPDTPGAEFKVGWMWYDAYLGTLADENIDKAIPFLNEKGHLCILGYACVLYEGGGDSFLIDLEEYEVSPYYRDDYQTGDVIIIK